MNSFYFLIAFILPVLFYLLPLILKLEDPRPLVKTLSLGVFLFALLDFVIKKFSKISVPSKEGTSSNSIIKEILFTCLLLFCFTFGYLHTLLMDLNSFFLVDFDYLAIAEILNNSISGNFFQTPHYGIQKTSNYLSHHFSPSILVLSPFLLFSETRLGYGYGLAFFAIASYILIAILLLRANLRGNMFYFSLFLFSCNLYLHRLFFSYHFELLSIFFFLTFFIGKEFKILSLSIISILLLLFLKEDMAIYVFFLGIYFLFQKNWKYGLSIVTTSLIYFFFIPNFFKTYIDQSAYVNWLSDWAKWGNSYLEITVNIITNPIKVAKIILSKWKILRDFAFSFSPILIAQPSIIIVSLPIFLLHFISDRIWYNSLYNYYSYSVVPLFVIGLIISLKNLKESYSKNYNINILLFCISLSLYSSSGDKMFPYVIRTTDSKRLENVKAIVQNIPNQKTISTQFDLGGFIPRANPIYPLHEKNLDTDYILVDRESGITPYVDRKRIEMMVQQITANHSYSIISKVDGLELYRRNNLH